MSNQYIPWINFVVGLDCEVLGDNQIRITLAEHKNMLLHRREHN